MAAPGRALDSEALTRRTRIDAALRESGWHIVPHLPGTPFASYHCAAVTEFPTANGPADYALIANNRILAIVEAKRSGLAIQEVLTQAQRYARGIRHLDVRGPSSRDGNRNAKTKMPRTGRGIPEVAAFAAEPFGGITLL
jgi:type I site-specific restriction endonuclease